MNILIGCEFSGVVREAFRARGHNAISCDFQATEQPGPHYQGDIRDILSCDWDMGIFFPPCNYLTTWSNWNIHLPDYQEKQEQALDFVRFLMAAPIEKIAIENPQGAINTRIRKADQKIHPWMFNHAEQKRTCLWLKNLPPLMATGVYTNRKEFVLAQEIHRGLKRSNARSRTFEGIAQAMVEQWG